MHFFFFLVAIILTVDNFNKFNELFWVEKLAIALYIRRHWQLFSDVHVKNVWTLWRIYCQWGNGNILAIIRTSDTVTLVPHTREWGFLLWGNGRTLLQRRQTLESLTLIREGGNWALRRKNSVCVLTMITLV